MSSGPWRTSPWRRQRNERSGSTDRRGRRHARSRITRRAGAAAATSRSSRRRTARCSRYATAARTRVVPCRQGIVHGHSVTCPLHNWVISLETGERTGRGSRLHRQNSASGRRRARPAGSHRPLHGARQPRAGWRTAPQPHHLPLLRRRLRRRRDAAGRTAPLRSTGMSSTRPISAASARRVWLWARRSSLDDRLLYPEIDGRRASGTKRSIWWRGVSPRPLPSMARIGRLLWLGPAAHRGLLRCQQADERLHRRGEHRHEFPALHGLVGRRSHPRLRIRHGARHL